MHHTHHYHLPRMHEMGRVYWCHSLGALAISLAALFVPIYLLKSGISFQGVILYSMAQYSLSALFTYPSVKTLARVSPHHMLVAGSLLMAIYFGILSSAQITTTSLILLAVIWALQHAIYWPTFHYIFSLARTKEHGNTQVAGLDALVIIAHTIAPAIGGIVATIFGIQYTYYVVVAILFVAGLPMLNRNQGPETIKSSFSFAQIRKINRDLWANMAHSTVFISESVLWPLFVFLIVSSYAGVGALSSVIAISSMGVTLFVGRRSEKRGEHPYINHGVATYGIGNIARALAQNATHIFGVNLLSGIGKSLYHAPYLSKYYKNSDEGNKLGYIAAMETVHSLAAGIAMALIFALSTALSVQATLTVGLAVAALTVIGVKLIR